MDLDGCTLTLQMMKEKGGGKIGPPLIYETKILAKIYEHCKLFRCDPSKNISMSFQLEDSTKMKL